jgi:hypothetical protein
MPIEWYAQKVFFTFSGSIRICLRGNQLTERYFNTIEYACTSLELVTLLAIPATTGYRLQIYSLNCGCAAALAATHFLPQTLFTFPTREHSFSSCVR